MATYTSHYNLKKPATSDKIRIADFNGNADIIDGQMYDNETLGAQLKSDIGIVENTNTATHNISAGQYVIWKGTLYTASDAISSGATLSDANLTAVSGGGLNALNSKINTTAEGAITTATGVTKRSFSSVKTGNSIIFAMQFDITTAKANGDVIFSDIPAEFRPNRDYFGFVQSSANMPCGVTVHTNGTITASGSGLPVGTWYGGEIQAIH